MKMGVYTFDITASTNNPIVLKGVYRDLLPVTSAKKSAEKVKIKSDNLFQADKQAFGSDIGSITNKSTSMYTMLTDINEVDKINEIEKRLILSRIAQGNSIDGAKGIITKPFPKHWYKYNNINNDDSYELKCQKELYNSILIEKKPYFFKHLYGTCKSEYNNFVKAFNNTTKIRLGLSLEDLLSKKDLNENELYYYNYYHSRSPLIDNKCVMNILCRYMENINIKIKKHKGDSNVQDIYMSRKYNELDKSLYYKIKKVVEKNKKMINEQIFDMNFRRRLGLSENEMNTVDNFEELLVEELLSISSNLFELTDYMVYLFYHDKPSYSKDVLWRIFGKYIYINVLNKSNGDIRYPKMNYNGEHSYMFDKYDIVEVNILDR